MINERRRAARYPTKAGEIVLLPFPVTVQVMDISAAGVLVQANRPIEVGTQGSLRLNIDGTVFQAEVNVRRVAPVASGKDLTYRIGAEFVRITPEHRQVIERFTNH
jgi:c-di-GMP-binding flagellar brake protein YcgR